MVFLLMAVVVGSVDVGGVGVGDIGGGCCCCLFVCLFIC